MYESVAKLPCDEVTGAKLPCGKVTGNRFFALFCGGSANLRWCGSLPVAEALKNCTIQYRYSTYNSLHYTGTRVQYHNGTLQYSTIIFIMVHSK